MKTGIVIPCYNRPEYLKITLDGLSKTDYYDNTTIVFVDDSSGNETKELLANFKLDKADVQVHFNENNYGVAYCIFYGINLLRRSNYDNFIILDADMDLKPEWIKSCLNLLSAFPENIISGFNCSNHVRLSAKSTGDGYVEKDDVGGCSLVFNENNIDAVYEALMFHHHWDSMLSDFMKKKGKPFIVCNPGVVNHIGELSSSTLNHVHFLKDENFVK